MSSMYVNRSAPGLGASLRDLPIISQALDFADARLQSLIQSIATRYAQFVEVQRGAPAMLADANKVVAVMNETGTAEQRAQAARYLAAAQEAQRAANNAGPVEKVVTWLSQARSAAGLGVIAIPIWLAGTAVAAIGIVTLGLSSWNEGRTIRAALAAGFTPEQIGRIGSTGILSGAQGLAKSLTWLIGIGGALYLVTRFTKARA